MTEKKKWTIDMLRVPEFKSAGRVNTFSNQNFEDFKNYLIKKKIDFQVRDNFSVKKIIWTQNGEERKRVFTQGFTHNSVMFMSIYLKNEIKKRVLDMEKIRLLMNFRYPQNYIYKEKNVITAYQYDLKNAFTVFMRTLPLCEKNTFDKLLEFKNSGYNINKILGMALLGTTFVSDYDKGKKRSQAMYEGENVIQKDTTPVFYLLKYLCVATVAKLCEKLNEFAIARYSDSFILSRRFETDFLIQEIIKCEIEVITRMSENLYRYNGIYLNNLFNEGEEEIDFTNLFLFHEQQVDSLIYSYGQNHYREMSFMRETKDKLRTERITYRANDTQNIFA